MNDVVSRNGMHRIMKFVLKTKNQARTMIAQPLKTRRAQLGTLFHIPEPLLFPSPVTYVSSPWGPFWITAVTATEVTAEATGRTRRSIQMPDPRVQFALLSARSNILSVFRAAESFTDDFSSTNTRANSPRSHHSLPTKFNKTNHFFATLGPCMFALADHPSRSPPNRYLRSRSVFSLRETRTDGCLRPERLP